MTKIFVSIAGLLLLCPALVLAAPAPYVPQAGDLSDSDKPSAATVRQVQNQAENFTPMPRRPSNTPVRPPQSQFQPRPYIPEASDPTARPTVSAAPLATSLPPAAPVAPSGASTSLPAASSSGKPAPIAGPEPAAMGNAEVEIRAVMDKALAAFSARDCAGLLKCLHNQAYVLVRTSWGEQGFLGHQQLKEAYCAELSAGKAPVVKLSGSRVQLVAADRGKIWGQLNAQGTNASFEADLVKEKGVWLITDAIIQHQIQ